MIAPGGLRGPGCRCQRAGKSGVPHLQSWRCLLCGDPVDRALPLVCPQYRPDHNGECETCDEDAAAHTYAAHALGDPGTTEAATAGYVRLAAGATVNRCPGCGEVIGVGLPEYHLPACEDCAPPAPADEDA